MKKTSRKNTRTKSRKRTREVKETFAVRQKRLNSRLMWVRTSFLFILTFLLFRIGYFKFVKGDEFEKAVLSRMSSTEREVEALRGSIVDRNNKTIATSTLAYHIILDPVAILELKEGPRNHTYDVLAKYANKKPTDVEKIVMDNKTSRYKVFIKNISAEDVEMLKAEGIKGVWYEETFIRQYPKEEFASQLIGFYNKTTGQYGIEQYYNEHLTGKAGRVFPKLQDGNIVTTEVSAPVNGHTLVLTLDEVIQQYVEQVMDQYVAELKTPNAAAVVMNPKTGEIYAMYSYPKFNPNSYTNLSEQLGKDQWNKLSSEEQNKKLYAAWKNFNTQYPYEPGSTFKPLVASIALEEGLVDPEKAIYYCTGSKVIADTTIRCWKREGHGAQTFAQVLANSCNPGIIEISEAIPSDVFSDYMIDFGIGELTHIDLPGEEKGIVHSKSKLGPVQKATTSMGQTFTTTTMQLLTGFSAVINGGYIMQPYVVSQVLDGEGNIVEEQVPVVKRQVISDQTSRQVAGYLEYAVNTGTGSHARIDGYRIGGKTGTAEKQPREEGKNILSFAGFAPVNDPEVLTFVLFDEIPEGTGAPARAFKDIMKNVIPYLGIASDADYEAPVIDMSIVPDIKSVNFYNAVERLSTEKLGYEVIGVGTKIVDQYPIPGTKLPGGSTVKIYVETDQPDKVAEVPDVTGLSIAEAQKAVEGQFTIEVKGNQSGKIAYQTPFKGMKIEKGNKIIVQTVE